MNSAEWIALCGLAFSIVAAIVGMGMRLTWILGKEFAATRQVLMEKLDYHEAHDDERFSHVDQRFTDVHDDIWQLRVEQAKRNGDATPIRRD